MRWRWSRSTTCGRPIGRCRASTTRRWSTSISRSKPGNSSACSGPAAAAGRPSIRIRPALGDGRPVTGASRDRGVVFQGDDSLFGWLTAVENVEFGLRMRRVPRAERRERALRFLDLVGLTGQEQKYPAELSGGMKQRIQLARALVNEPTMLLMDEPFAALDAQTRALMQVELANIWHATRTTVLFITHDIDEAVTLGGRIGVMRAGPRSQVKGVVEVALNGARSRTDDAFLRYYKQVYEMIRDEVAKSIAGAS